MSTTTATTAGDDVTADELLVASVEGVGSIRRTGGSDPEVRLTAVAADYEGALPDGFTSVGPGLKVKVDGRLDRSLEVRLTLHERPADRDLPLVLHVGDDGELTAKFGLWLPETNEIAIWTDGFSSLYPTMIPMDSIPADVLEDLVDEITDYFTGRIDEPPCADDVEWGSFTITELSSVHVCLQMGVADQADLILTSNRKSMQIVPKPATADYITRQQDLFWFTEFVGPLLGANDSHVLLRGHRDVTFAFTRKPSDVDFPIVIDQTKRLIVVNGLLSAFGGADSESNEVLATILAATHCVSDTGAFGGEVIDTVAEVLETGIECAISILSDKTLAHGVIDLAAEQFDSGVATRIAESAKTGADRLRPSAKKLSWFLGLVNASVFAWDTIFDNLAKSRIDVHFDGSIQQVAVSAPTQLTCRYIDVQFADTPPRLVVWTERWTWVDESQDETGYRVWGRVGPIELPANTEEVELKSFDSNHFVFAELEVVGSDPDDSISVTPPSCEEAGGVLPPPPSTTTITSPPTTEQGITPEVLAEQFIGAANRGDRPTVDAIAPSVSSADLDRLLAGRPYTLDGCTNGPPTECYAYNDSSEVILEVGTDAVVFVGFFTG